MPSHKTQIDCNCVRAALDCSHDIGTDPECNRTLESACMQALDFSWGRVFTILLIAMGKNTQLRKNVVTTIRSLYLLPPGDTQPNLIPSIHPRCYIHLRWRFYCLCMNSNRIALNEKPRAHCDYRSLQHLTPKRNIQPMKRGMQDVIASRSKKI